MTVLLSNPVWLKSKVTNAQLSWREKCPALVAMDRLSNLSGAMDDFLEREDDEKMREDPAEYQFTG